MKKIKVRIYKDPNGQGEYVNKTANFLKKARSGMQVDSLELEEEILNQLTITQDVDVIASKLEDDYGLDYFEALDQIENVVGGLYRQDVTATKNEILDQDPNVDQPEVIKPKLYNTDEPWISDDNSGWDDFGEETEDAEGTSEYDDLAQEDEQALSLEKKGGTVSKKKFVKTVVRGLRKAAEGMQQEQSSEASPMDTPIGGRESHIAGFRRGMKDLGNEFYAKQIYEATQKLKNQTEQLPTAQPGMMRGQNGMQVEQDPENYSHHLLALAEANSNIFDEPMNQIHGAGFENIPEARRGREQRQADRQQKNMSKDWNNAFGDMAAGYFGVPGMPNYLQVVNPQTVNPQANVTSQNQGNPTGPFIDVNYKKGPWWSGKREWSAKGIPAEMLMGAGRGNGVMPGHGYMPSNSWSNSSSWSTQRTFPGEVIRSKSRTINAAADPTKNSSTSSTTTTSNSSSSNIIDNTNTSANTSTVLNNNPENNSTAQNLEENEYIQSFMDKTLDPENKMHSTQFSFMNVQDPEELRQGNFDNYYFTDPKTGVTYMSNNFGTEMDAGKQSWNPVTLPPEQMERLGHPIQHWDSDPNNPDGAPIYNPEKSRFIKPSNWLQYEYDQSKDMGQPFDEDKYYQTNYPQEYNQLIKAYGGPVSNPQMDANGNLQRFVYGGNDMGVSPIVAYDNNDINSKDTDDPFMFRKGGLYKFYGEENSQVDFPTLTNPPAATPPNQYQTPAFNRYNSNATAQSNFAAFNEMKKRGLVTGNYDPTQSYDMSNSGTTTKTSGSSGIKANSPAPGYTWEEWNALPEATRTKIGQSLEGQSTQNQGTTTQGGYPTAPSIKQQLLDKFSPFKRNQETGKFYDFMWASQQGAPTTADGKPYQVPGATQPGATQGSGQPGQGQPGTGQPNKAGYYYDYKLEKGPWWKGSKQSMSMTGRWIDPNNPNAGTSANKGQFNNGQGPTINAGNTNQPTTNTGNTNQQSIYSNTEGLSNSAQRQIRQGEGEMMRNDKRVAENPEGTVPFMFNAPGGGNQDNFGFGTKMKMFGAKLAGANQKQYGGYMAYGGDVPKFAGPENSQVSGSGPFDPNNNLNTNNNVNTNDCSEEDTKDPNSPCYVSAFARPGATLQEIMGITTNTEQPQDFTANYDLNKARTLDLGNVGNIGMAAARIGTGAGNMADSMYNENYLNSRTDSGNRQATNYNETHGGYGANDQRIYAKTEGRGANGFNSVVGTGAFSKLGGQLKYAKGGVYDLTEEEVGKILAAGGQIKFIK
jgi:hypothetical protein